MSRQQKRASERQAAKDAERKAKLAAEVSFKDWLETFVDQAGRIDPSLQLSAVPVFLARHMADDKTLTADQRSALLTVAAMVCKDLMDRGVVNAEQYLEVAAQG